MEKEIMNTKEFGEGKILKKNYKNFMINK